MAVSRREFCEWLGASGLAASLPSASLDDGLFQGGSAAPAASHIGTLYPFVQKQADRSRFELSFLQKQFRSLAPWQKIARAKVLEHLFYAPPPVAPMPEIVRREDRGAYVQEYLTFQTTPDLRVPAYVLIPKNVKRPAPGDRAAALPRRLLRVGQGEGRRARGRAPGAHRLQAAALWRQEHRHRAGPPRLRRHRDRHVLLGRAPHAARRRSRVVPRAAGDDQGTTLRRSTGARSRASSSSRAACSPPASRGRA